MLKFHYVNGLPIYFGTSDDGNVDISSVRWYERTRCVSRQVYFTNTGFITFFSKRMQRRVRINTTAWSEENRPQLQSRILDVLCEKALNTTEQIHCAKGKGNTSKRCPDRTPDANNNNLIAVLSSETWHCLVRNKFTDVSGEYLASVTRCWTVRQTNNQNDAGSRKRVLLVSWSTYSSEMSENFYRTASQKIVLFTVIDVIASNTTSS
jgi:hypothetical protein